MSRITWEGEVCLPVIIEVGINDESYEVLSVKLAEPDEVKDAIYEQCGEELGEMVEAEILRQREEDEEDLDEYY